jgi:type VI secretion system secreted protein VgrG
MTNIYILKGNITESVVPDYKAPVITSVPEVLVKLGNANLQSASTFAVLGDTAVTNTGATVLNGDLGIAPGSTITGFPPGTYTGALHQGDAAAAQAHADATAAATALSALTPFTDISSTDLGGATLVPGNYHASSTGTWSAGPLTLNGAGQYVFVFGTGLTMPANATVVLENGATADNVYFVTGTTFTFGANCTVNGNILAGTSITFAASSVLNGRALTYGPSGTTVTFPSAGTVAVPASSGNAFSYQVTAINSPTAFYATYLPWDLTINQSTGLITGTIFPNSVGEFRIPLQAANDAGVGTMILTILI